MDLTIARAWAKEIQAKGEYYSGGGSGYECFVDDGIVCREKWIADKNPRILVLLREAREQGDRYKVEDGIFSLTEYLTDGKRWENSRTYKPVSEWIQAIFRYKGFSAVTPGENVFEYVAVANLKKTPGNEKSDRKELNKFCRDFKSRLSEQIAAIAPNIIILANEYDNFIEITSDCIKKPDIKHYTSKRKEKSPLGLHVCEWIDNRKAVLIFNAYHPCANRTVAEDFKTVLEQCGQREEKE